MELLLNNCSLDLPYDSLDAVSAVSILSSGEYFALKPPHLREVSIIHIPHVKIGSSDIHNVAVVSTLYGTNYSTILFNSLSNTFTTGGSVNDTFIVSRTGTFYNECLIGNHAKDGEFGLFIVE